MAVGVFARERILVLSQSVVELVIEKALGQVPIPWVSASPIGQEEILRQGISFVLGVRYALVRTGFLLLAA